MIECTHCHTLNPEVERVCLACGGALPAKGPTGTSALAVARCPAGHPVDPAWASCPYCDRQRAQGGSPPAGATRLEGAIPGPMPVPRQTRLEAPAPPAAVQATRLEEPAPSAGRRTVLHESPAGAPATRLVAALAAPALGSGGTVFPLRAGRNSIGTDRANEIVLAGDPEVSREHAVLLYRNGAFHLTDHQSTNGTRVNGREVPADGTVELHDQDHLCCGTTELVLLVIGAGAAVAAPPTIPNSP